MIIFPFQNMKDLPLEYIYLCLEYFTFIKRCHATRIAVGFSIFTYLGSHEFLLCALGTDDILAVCDET
jgi:hypothetical protein